MLAARDATDPNSRCTQLLDRVLRSTSSRSAAIFLFDTRCKTSWVHYLHAHGVSDQAFRDYAEGGIYRHDPFLDPAVIEGWSGNRQLTIVDWVDRDKTLPRGTKAYWSFVDRHDLGAPAAFVRNLVPGIQLIIGIHGRSRSASAPLSSFADDIEWLSDAILARAFDRAMGRIDLSTLTGPASFAGARGEADDGPAPLSRREEQLITLVMQGLRNKQIAYELSISENTVETHLRRIYRKMGIQNRAALVNRFMNRQGMYRTQ